ncbi:beta-N-acetylhexosaminidase [Flavihumibacter fluvii]|uniref:beta-N-acetylhexosaminidase n=1 Tax=Flavihumibacter fluvii TaxID=2838157 RepID=UPI001BDE9481|nr:beta-N-acetylhexosaminidase [Flavihumibacter fluvii]ULQ52014.1 beta-N-acetylhexosaminidase [Flavihumibacter fluvii]
MTRTIILCFVLFTHSLFSYSANIIPMPAYLQENKGQITLSAQTSITASGDCANELSFLKRWLADEFALTLAGGNNSATQVLLVADPVKFAAMGKEGYALLVTPKSITIQAPYAAGIFYGMQSLRQLVQASADRKSLVVNCITVKDNPRFGIRSFMLDEGRYFKGERTVKRLLDEMALLKMNTFHWHLTDDQGWRLEIKKYPLLTQVGGQRDSSQTGGWNSTTYDGKPHKGFYTQEQVKAIIRYAADRHINIIPEIEMPGHASAAIAAYPWLGITKKQVQVPVRFGVMYDIFDVSDPKVVSFLQDVLDEVTALFPSPIIHIGGDEVKYDQWVNSAAVAAYMKSNKMSSPADLQIGFTNEMSRYIEKKGKRMMGWNDIMGSKLHEYNDALPVTGTLSASAIIQFWKGDIALIKDAAVKSHDIVNSFHEFTYMDYDYTSIPLSKAYGFDPVPAGLEERYHSRIIGTGCQMWGEWTPDEASMNGRVFPRLAAYAEVGWTIPSRKNFDRFQAAMPFFYDRWK